MALNELIPLYDTLLDYLVEKATAQEILAYKASPEEQERADDLTEKNKIGGLSADEQVELQQMIEVNVFVMLLKAKALSVRKMNNL